MDSTPGRLLIIQLQTNFSASSRSDRFPLTIITVKQCKVTSLPHSSDMLAVAVCFADAHGAAAHDQSLWMRVTGIVVPPVGDDVSCCSACSSWHRDAQLGKGRMSGLAKQVSATVAVLQSFNKIKPESITKERLESICCKLKGPLTLFTEQFSNKTVPVSVALRIYVDEGLVKQLVPSLIRLQNCGVADGIATATTQLGMETWELVMDLLIQVVHAGNSMREDLPKISKKVLRAVLPDSPSLPGDICFTLRAA